MQRRHDWETARPLMGRITDAELARRMGCTRTQVSERRKAFGIAPLRPRPAAWTMAEDNRLRSLWGSRSVLEISRLMGRPPKGIRHQAVHVLRLGSPGRDRMSRAEAERYTGWCVKALDRAARAVGLPWQPQPDTRTDGRKRSRATLLLDAEQVDQLAEWLEQHPAKPSTNLLGPGGPHPRCRSCLATGLPHGGKGLCRPCYNRARYARQKEMARCAAT